MQIRTVPQLGRPREVGTSLFIYNSICICFARNSYMRPTFYQEPETFESLHQGFEFLTLFSRPASSPLDGSYSLS